MTISGYKVINFFPKHKNPSLLDPSMKNLVSQNILSISLMKDQIKNLETRWDVIRDCLEGKLKLLWSALVAWYAKMESFFHGYPLPNALRIKLLTERPIFVEQTKTSIFSCLPLATRKDKTSFILVKILLGFTSATLWIRQ